MNTGPKVATTPLEVLTSRETVEPPLLVKYWLPSLCGVLGFSSIIYTNWSLKRPIISGIHRHVIATAIGIGIGKFIEKYRNENLADRDAVLRHYVELHPEDFPPFKRQKYADVFERWIPIR